MPLKGPNDRRQIGGLVLGRRSRAAWKEAAEVVFMDSHSI